jgi:hypothetical protein
MDFDQIGVGHQFQDTRPQAEQHALKILFADIAQADPNHLWRWAFQHETIKKIGIAGEYRPVSFPGMLPKLVVSWARTQIAGVGANDWQAGGK